jgi:hypothetical protein
VTFLESTGNKCLGLSLNGDPTKPCSCAFRGKYVDSSPSDDFLMSPKQDVVSDCEHIRRVYV